ncbi:MAG TPA: DnaJ domain-containing protein [bacterium]|nr:DnaJ domain-containing protein [bacterium]
MSDHYNLLGVGPQASAAEIRGAFRRLAKLCHPDTHPRLPPSQQAELNQRFILLAQAYAVLSDPARRQAYDRQRQAGPRQPRQQPSRQPGPGAASQHAAPGAQAAASASGAQKTAARPKSRSGTARGTTAASGAARAPGGPDAQQGGAPGRTSRTAPEGTSRAGRAASQGATASGARAAGATPPQDAALHDLVRDLDDLLTRFGLGLRQPWDRVVKDLLDWARSVFQEGTAPRGRSRAQTQPGATAKRQNARPATQEGQAADAALEAELEALRRQVRSGRRPTSRAPTLDEELAELKRRLGRH